MGMTVREAIMTLNDNVIFACERSGFDSATVKMIEDALDTIEDALKAQEPLLVTHIHEEYPEHLWKKDENGNVNEWAMEFDYHQGPVCERCGDTFCIHCEPDGYITHKKCVVDVYKCPKCGSELRSNQKHCAKCGQAVKWE